MWLIPIRPDINYATNEPSRSMKQPIQQDVKKLQHLLKYRNGAFERAYDPAPKLTVTDDVSPDVVIYVDSDWAG
eukprot:11198864-Lingulodinium_polyedra.AAC.1